MEAATDDLCKFHERPVSQVGAVRLYLPGVRHHGEGALAHVPGSDEAQLPHARVRECPAMPIARPPRISGSAYPSRTGSASSRIRHVREANAATRFLSIEPLIGPLGALDLSGIAWVIAGGESGPRARPMEIGWVRSVRDQCLAQDVPFFFKQWGGIRPKSGGRELDGREWNEFPRRRGQRQVRRSLIAAE